MTEGRTLKNILLGTILSVLAITTQNLAQDRPNILFIICDDLQFESTDDRFKSMQSINYYNEGNDRPHTPTLDSLAGAGLEFTRAYTSSTVCAPARYSVLTGRYAGHNKSQYYLDSQDDNQLAGEDTFLARIENTNIAMEKGNQEHTGMNLQTQLSKAGYLTGIAGKWHLGPHLKNNAQSWQDFGMEKYSQTADPQSNGGVNKQMKDNQLVLQEIIKTYGWDMARNIYVANTLELRNDKLNVHNIEWTVKGAFEILDVAAQDPNKPFFLYFSTTLHHGPDPWSGGNASSTKADVRYTGDGFYTEGVQHKGVNVMPTREEIINETLAAGKLEVDAWTLLLDKAVGALLGRLDVLNMSENTMVIFTSDHGFDRYGKASILEGGIHVPLFITWKNKIPPGSRIDQIVGSIDHAPTLYHYAGILGSLPSEYLMNGVSLHPYIETQDNSIVTHNDLYTEIGYARGVVTKDDKYIAIRYPNKINQQIENGNTWDPFMSGDPKLSQPYLLANRHLGHWSSNFNTQYFNLDQYYDYSTDPEDFVNLLYEDNDTPLPEGQIPADVKAGRDRLQERLSSYLNMFEGAYFGEFHDGVPVKVDDKGIPVRSGNVLTFNGYEFRVSGQDVSSIDIYDIKGNHVMSLVTRNKKVVPWNGKNKSGNSVPVGIYTAISAGGSGNEPTRFVMGIR